jgi:rhodanese-related sulfurtransferase
VSDLVQNTVPIGGHIAKLLSLFVGIVIHRRRIPMPQQINRGYKVLVDEAESKIENLSAAEAHARMSEGGALLVDVRDVRELERDGRITGAFHCPRGMLEFWIDPESPYHKAEFAEDRQFIFICAGGWRSALSAAAARDMGLQPVAHVRGGFRAWKEAGAPVDE